MRRLVEFTARIWVETPEFNKLLFSENLHEARHIKESDVIPQMYNPLLETMRELLEKGEQAGVFRSGIDPVDLYISISALSSHYISHHFTFEAIFKRPMMDDDRLTQRIEHATDMVLRYLRA